MAASPKPKTIARPEACKDQETRGPILIFQHTKVLDAFLGAEPSNPIHNNGANLGLHKRPLDGCMHLHKLGCVYLNLATRDQAFLDNDGAVANTVCLLPLWQQRPSWLYVILTITSLEYYYRLK